MTSEFSVSRQGMVVGAGPVVASALSGARADTSIPLGDDFVRHLSDRMLIVSDNINTLVEKVWWAWTPSRGNAKGI